jgi:sugar O-acyltransferase (sialic acid O-acetyltransferase NeuD family)
MKKRLVIFGTGDIAQLADFYFVHDSDYEVVAFTVDREYIRTDQLFGRPLVAFQDLEQMFAPKDHELFVAVSYAQLNALRRRKYEEGKMRGYRIATYVSSRATVWSSFSPGENCFILEDNTLQPFARIGHNVTLWSGNHIGHHSVIGAHTFIASHAVISGGVQIGEQCFIGVNATLRDHIKIGDRCVIGAGALILGDAEPDGVYVGAATERSKVPSTRLRKI